MAYSNPGGLTFSRNGYKIRCGKHCLFQDLLHWGTVANFSHCVQFNKAGKAQSSTDRINFNLKWNKRQDFKLYVHEKDTAPYALDYGAFQASLQQDMDIRIKTTKIKRLQSPYPSNCLTEEEGRQLNIFPGKYTINSCVESKRCLNAFKECGNSFDFCRPFIPEEIRVKYINLNNTFHRVRKCLKNHAGHYFVEQCRPQCEEVQFEVQPFSRPLSSEIRYAKPALLQLILLNPGSYMERREKPMFSFEDLLGITGGTIGLFCGFSIMSIMELMIFFGLKLISKPESKDESVDMKIEDPEKL